MLSISVVGTEREMTIERCLCKRERDSRTAGRHVIVRSAWPKVEGLDPGALSGRAFERARSG